MADPQSLKPSDVIDTEHRPIPGRTPGVEDLDEAVLAQRIRDQFTDLERPLRIDGSTVYDKTGRFLMHCRSERMAVMMASWINRVSMDSADIACVWYAAFSYIRAKSEERVRATAVVNDAVQHLHRALSEHKKALAQHRNEVYDREREAARADARRELVDNDLDFALGFATDVIAMRITQISRNRDIGWQESRRQRKLLSLLRWFRDEGHKE